MTPRAKSRLFSSSFFFGIIQKIPNEFKKGEEKMGVPRELKKEGEKREVPRESARRVHAGKYSEYPDCKHVSGGATDTTGDNRPSIRGQ